MKQRKLLSQRHPILYFLAVWTRRLRRYGDWYFDNKKYAKERTTEKIAFRVKKHQSVLLKKLGDNNEQLQLNKVTNLKIAVKQLDGILIKPGETFSFCKLVGLPTKRKGYLLGMELSFGEARAVYAALLLNPEAKIARNGTIIWRSKSRNWWRNLPNF